VAAASEMDLRRSLSGDHVGEPDQKALQVLPDVGIGQAPADSWRSRSEHQVGDRRVGRRLPPALDVDRQRGGIASSSENLEPAPGERLPEIGDRHVDPAVLPDPRGGRELGVCTGRIEESRRGVLVVLRGIEAILDLGEDREGEVGVSGQPQQHGQLLIAYDRRGPDIGRDHEDGGRQPVREGIVEPHMAMSPGGRSSTSSQTGRPLERRRRASASATSVPSDVRWLMKIGPAGFTQGAAIADLSSLPFQAGRS
jgi:hypothetical protein